MTWKQVIIIPATLLSIICAGLVASNPSLVQYRQLILTQVAKEEADKLAMVDRLAIEREAARISAEFAAVQFDAHKLDAARLQRNYPLLGTALIAVHHGENGRSFTENLERSKQQALLRVTTAHETILYGTLADLTTRTKHVSYGMWSLYTTCLDKRALSYTGIAGRFFERVSTACTAGPLQ